MLPKCLCGKEMEFVMNNSGMQLYKCSCGRVMVRARAQSDMRSYYQLEKQTWPEDNTDNLLTPNVT